MDPGTISAIATGVTTLGGLIGGKKTSTYQISQAPVPGSMFGSNIPQSQGLVTGGNSPGGNTLTGLGGLMGTAAKLWGAGSSLAGGSAMTDNNLNGFMGKAGR